MRKTFAMTALALLFLVLLASCGDTSPPSGDGALNITVKEDTELTERTTDNPQPPIPADRRTPSRAEETERTETHSDGIKVKLEGILTGGFSREDMGAIIIDTAEIEGGRVTIETSPSGMITAVRVAAFEKGDTLDESVSAALSVFVSFAEAVLSSELTDGEKKALAAAAASSVGSSDARHASVAGADAYVSRGDGCFILNL
jgi:hypothetical protein